MPLVPGFLEFLGNGRTQRRVVPSERGSNTGCLSRLTKFSDVRRERGVSPANGTARKFQCCPPKERERSKEVGPTPAENSRPNRSEGSTATSPLQTGCFQLGIIRPTAPPIPALAGSTTSFRLPLHRRSWRSINVTNHPSLLSHRASLPRKGWANDTAVTS